MDLSQIGVKIYKLNSSKVSGVKKYLSNSKPTKYSKDKKLLISFKEYADINKEEQKTLVDVHEKDFIYTVDIDRRFPYFYRGAKKTAILTKTYYLVLREINGDTYLFCFMPRSLINSFEGAIDNAFNGTQIMRVHKIKIDDIPAGLFNYRKFTLEKISSPMVSKVSAEGDNMANSDIYKKYKGMQGKVTDVIIIEKNTPIRLYPDAFFLIKSKMSINDRINLCFGILMELNKNNLVECQDWDRELSEFPELEKDN
jgi:hypothetical protein